MRGVHLRRNFDGSGDSVFFAGGNELAGAGQVYQPRALAYPPKPEVPESSRLWVENAAGFRGLSESAGLGRFCSQAPDSMIFASGNGMHSGFSKKAKGKPLRGKVAQGEGMGRMQTH